MDAYVTTTSSPLEKEVCSAGNFLAPLFLCDPCLLAHDGLFANDSAFAEMRRALQAIASNPTQAECQLDALKESAQATDIDELTLTYRCLFVGPAPMAAPPWGSVYTDKDCVIFGTTTGELRAWMRGHRIQRASDESTPDDHIGLMLALMAWIARERPELLDEYLQKHLCPWAGHYLRQLALLDQNGLYGHLAQLTMTVLGGLVEKRSLDVVTPRFYR